jgi:hypothetical protein
MKPSQGWTSMKQRAWMRTLRMTWTMLRQQRHGGVLRRRLRHGRAAGGASGDCRELWRVRQRLPGCGDTNTDSTQQ